MLQTLPIPSISLHEEQILVELARRAVWQAWRCGSPLQPVESFYRNRLRRQQASLVTIRDSDGQLLTRSATIEPSVPLVCDVVHNAFEAAQHCSPYCIRHNGSRSAWDGSHIDWTIDVSAVSPLVYLDVHSLDELLERVLPAEHALTDIPQDAVEQDFQPSVDSLEDGSLEPNWIRPGVHGLFLRKGDQHASLPPDKWYGWPDPNLFIWKLQQHAGLDPQTWTPDTLVAIYTVQTTPPLTLDVDQDWQNPRKAR